MGPMNCTEILKARVTPEIKRQAKAIADRELLTEAAWLKRVVMKEIRSIERSGAGADHDQLLQIRPAAHDSAEFERELIRERTIAGMERARAAGKRIGRLSLSSDTHAKIKALARGRLSNRAIAREVGVSEASVRRHRARRAA